MQDVYSLPQRKWFSLKQFDRLDWLYAALLIIAVITSLFLFGARLDTFDKNVLIILPILLVALGRHWKPIRPLLITAGIISLIGIYLYQQQLSRAEQNFFLQYFLASQSAFIWMSFLFFLATFAYWVGLLIRSSFSSRAGTALTWCAVIFGLVGMLVRWYESYLLGSDIGHIPVSNLYEVFILFSLITALLYLFYEQRYQTHQIGPFALLLISSAVGFLFWYAFQHNAQEIQPLIPALQSYWIKIHVPANFIGYGAFSLAAMVGVVYLLEDAHFFDGALPNKQVLDDIMYRTIAIGFTFFTIATILGALWAAEAWGSYWSWDPKETWALIVWLNYAAWLHLRLVKGLQGKALAWWAIIGLFVTLFAFLGVNLYLSGLHSYGSL